MDEFSLLIDEIYRGQEEQEGERGRDVWKHQEVKSLLFAQLNNAWKSCRGSLRQFLVTGFHEEMQDAF